MSEFAPPYLQKFLSYYSGAQIHIKQFARVPMLTFRQGGCLPLRGSLEQLPPCSSLEISFQPSPL